MWKLLVLALLTSCAQTTKKADKPFPQTPSCENGECVSEIIDRLNNLEGLYKKQCLPESKKGPIEQCLNYILDINFLDQELQRLHNRLEAKVGCEGGDCKIWSPGESINYQIAELTKSQKSAEVLKLKDTKQTIEAALKTIEKHHHSKKKGL